jgi:hypothetical protein
VGRGAVAVGGRGVLVGGTVVGVAGLGVAVCRIGVFVGWGISVGKEVSAGSGVSVGHCVSAGNGMSVGGGVSVGSGVGLGGVVLVAEGMGVNVGLRVLTGTGVVVGALTRKPGVPQPRPIVPRSTSASNNRFCFMDAIPFQPWMLDAADCTPDGRFGEIGRVSSSNIKTGPHLDVESHEPTPKQTLSGLVSVKPSRMPRVRSGGAAF